MPYGVPPYGVDNYGNPIDPVLGDLVYVELPGIYIDSLIFDEVSEGLWLFNAVPGPGTTDNPRDTLVEFDIFDTSGSIPTVASINVTVNGLVAIAAGAFVGPFNGAESAITGGGTDTVHVVIDYTSDYASEEIVEVVVTAANAAATYTLDEAYSFQIEDYTPPKLLSALPRSEKVVRLVFDEPMKQENAAEADDALNPANYAFTALTIPAVPVIAVSAVTISSTVVDIYLDTELTPGATYKVVVTGAVDTSDNVIIPPDNEATFAGYVCDRPADRDFDLWNFVPPVLKSLDENNGGDGTRGDFELWIACLQEPVDVLLCEIDRFTELADPDLAPEYAVDAMLVDLGNQFNFVLSLDEKKKLVKTLIEIYKQKGTAKGIENVINFFLGLVVQVIPLNAPTEIWELGIDELGVDTYLGPSDQYLLYSFKIVSPIALTEEQKKRITDIANYMKPAHTHLIAIEEPETPVVVDDWELGLSELGEKTSLHE